MRERMSLKARRELLARILVRYAFGTALERKQILSQFVADVTIVNYFSVRIDSLILQPSRTCCLIRCVTKIWEVTDGSGYQQKSEVGASSSAPSAYRESTKQEKSRILDEFVAVAKCHRKHAVRLLGQQGDETAASAAASGRRIYDEAVREALVVAWEASDRICGKRLKAILPTLCTRRKWVHIAREGFKRLGIGGIEVDIIKARAPLARDSGAHAMRWRPSRPRSARTQSAVGLGQQGPGNTRPSASAPRRSPPCAKALPLVPASEWPKVQKLIDRLTR